jgi:flavin-dependent dehydrogenase
MDVDLAIVGGGPAGLSTALHLQAVAPRLAARTVVLERDRYPRDKICGGALGSRGIRALDAIGVAVDVPAIRLDAVALRVGGKVITVREPGLGVVVRRIELDHALARAAIARGIDVRDGCAAARIAEEGDRIAIETATGDTIRARAVVGADGVGGVVRRFAGFDRGRLRAQVVELDSEPVAGDADRDTIVFDFDARDLCGYTWDFPTLVDGRAMVCRGAYAIGTSDDPQARVAAHLAARGLDVARYTLKQFAERGLAPGAAIARPRVLLVGEAAGIDIATGEGIAQAIEYGACAATYLAAAFERDDLGFADWRRRVDRHHVGWQLAIRYACYRAFYGPRRAGIEAMMPRLPALMRIAARDFAGAPQSRLDVVVGACQLLGAVAREGLRLGRSS